MERFRAYEGKQPYAFISYAHMDSDRVYEIISALNNDGNCAYALTEISKQNNSKDNATAIVIRIRLI